MEEMSWIAWIVAGIIAGWIAEQLTGRRHGLITNLIVGLLGAFVGGWLADTMNFWEWYEQGGMPLEPSTDAFRLGTNAVLYSFTH